MQKLRLCGCLLTELLATYQLLTTYYSLLAIYCLLLTAGYLLPTVLAACCLLLPATCYLLPATCCLQLMQIPPPDAPDLDEDGPLMQIMKCSEGETTTADKAALHVITDTALEMRHDLQLLHGTIADEITSKFTLKHSNTVNLSNAEFALKDANWLADPFQKGASQASEAAVSAAVSAVEVAQRRVTCTVTEANANAQQLVQKALSNRTQTGAKRTSKLAKDAGQTLKGTAQVTPSDFRCV